MEYKGKVFLTGANGLLGSHVARALTQCNYRVLAIVRPKANCTALAGIDCELIECDYENEQELVQLLKGCFALIHCAGTTQSVNTKMAVSIRVNTELTSRLIELSKLLGIHRFVYVSTANCLTNGTKDHPGNERSEFMPWLKRSAYAYSKYLAHQLVLKAFAEEQFPGLIVAPTFIIGSGDTHQSSGQLILYGFNKRLVLYPPGGKSIIDADYAAEAIVQSVTTGKPGETYLLSGENLTYGEILRKVGKQSSVRPFLIRIPAFLLKTVACICSLLQSVFGLPLVFDRTNQRLLCLGNYFSNKKAVDQLQLKQTNSDQAISKAIRWYKHEGYL